MTRRIYIQLAAAFVLVSTVLAVHLTNWAGRQSSDQLKSAVASQVQTVEQWYVAKTETAEVLTQEIFSDELAARLGRSEVPAMAPAGRRLVQSPVSAIVFIQPNASGVQTVSWAAGNAEIQNWPMSFAAGLISGLPAALTSKLTWVRFESPTGQAILGLVKAIDFTVAGQNQKGTVVGLFPATYFSGVHQVFADQGQQFFIADSRGFALAFHEQQYVGAQLKNLKSFAELEKVNGMAGHSDFKDQGKTFLAEYEKVSLGQVSIMVANPKSAATAWNWSFTIMFLIAVFGALIALYFITEKLLPSADISGATSSPAIKFTQPVAQQMVSQQTGTQIVNPLVAVSNSSSAGGRVNAQRALKGVSQSLWGPITSILGHAQMARAKEKDPAAKEHYTVIEREARSLRELLDSFEAYTPNATAAAPKTRVDLSELVMKVVALNKEEISKNNIQVQKNLGTVLAVSAAEPEIQQAMNEVIVNAIDALKTAKGPKTLSITGEQANGSAKISIQDSGAGIPQEQLHKVFDAFYSTQKKDSHLGLGLTLALKGVEKNGGKISVDSKPGAWTRVEFEFPLMASQRLMQVEDTAAELPVEVPKKLSEKTEIGKPLVGSEEVSLPAAPGLDEITVSNIGLSEPSIELETITNVTEPPISIKDRLSEYEVKIRAPKVKEK